MFQMAFYVSYLVFIMSMNNSSLVHIKRAVNGGLAGASSKMDAPAT